MSTLFFSHASSLEHDTGPGHPESAARLQAVLDTLDGPEFETLERRTAPLGLVEDIQRVHDADYVQRVFAAVPSEGYATLDADTVLSPGSGEAALYTVGGVCAAVDAVHAREADNAFCALRPPGHHAERDRGMGFCLFNNVAIAAFHAVQLAGIERVAVMDFDVHHGNGTQQAFWEFENLMYASTHQSPCYPGTGSVSERGRHNNIVNAPLPPGSSGEDFRAAFASIRTALTDFAPNMLILSAGFDAHAEDPLADLNLTEADFIWVTQELQCIAEIHAQGRLISVMEGGYSVPALTRSVAAHVKVLMSQ